MNIIELSKSIHEHYSGWKQIDIITGNWVYVGDRLYKHVSTSSLRRLHRLIDRGKRAGLIQQPLLTPTYFWKSCPVVENSKVEEIVMDMPLLDPV